jgi:peptidoglycan hydrolase-like protein with peptidoglycan-binding domain
METLAYLHLALAHEATTFTEYTGLETTWESRKLLNWLTQPHRSTSTTVGMLALTVALGVLGMARQASAVVQQGARGQEVTAIQQRLQQLGYFKGNITGYFGSLTKEAVIQFQQAKGLTPDGIVGRTTEASLLEQAEQSPKPVRQSSNDTWKLGDRGEHISVLQESLAAAGFSSGTNGIFDEPTQEAVRRFQQAKGLTVDGVVGPQTRAALPAISQSNQSTAPAKASSRSNIQALQRRLQAQGFYSGPIDGNWGPQTQAAVEAAQRAYSVSTKDLRNGGY